MESKKAALIRERWGSKKCNHDEIVREYQFGVPLETYVCTRCGKAFSLEEYIKARKQPAGRGRPSRFYETA